jgi:2-polyprenyl-6-methoxyphenol hydroxylase-like FAD-dependent oxidoreductase
MTDVVLQADAVIVGGGPGGITGAALFGRFGWAVELFDATRVRARYRVPA